MFDFLKKKVTKATNQTGSQCDHDPNSPSSSLKKVNKRTMVTPDQCGFVCLYCGQAFTFKRDANGHFSKM